MIDTNRLLGDARRANAEILFIALLTASVVGIGAAGITLANSATDDTSDQMDQPGFEVIEEQGDLSVNYEDGPLLSHYDETEEIRIYYNENEYYTVYNSTDDYDLQSNELLVTADEVVEEYPEIGPDTTIEVVWVRKNGESEVVDEMYIPDEDVSGMNHGDDGNITPRIDGGNLTSTE